MLGCRVGGQSAPTGALFTDWDGDPVRLGFWSVLFVSLFHPIKGWADLRMGCLPTEGGGGIGAPRATGERTGGGLPQVNPVVKGATLTQRGLLPFIYLFDPVLDVDHCIAATTKCHI